MICDDKRMCVLVTGASGMIGSEAVLGLLALGYRVIGVDRREGVIARDDYEHCVCDLSDEGAVRSMISSRRIDRIVHLAALAHSVDGSAFSWEDYYRLNVECARNIFEAAGKIPVLFISTVDVYGFTKNPVSAQTELRPVSLYAKSKAMAEAECKRLSHYTVFRFSPVYTDTVKRDIQKRYYLKYPNIAYLIGKGTEYEVLHVKNAVFAIAEWCAQEPKNEIRVVKDAERMDTARCIESEKREGRARIVLRIPKWMASAGYSALKAVTGENKYTYLLNKAVHPLRTE